MADTLYYVVTSLMPRLSLMRRLCKSDQNASALKVDPNHARTLPKKTYLWWSNLSDIYVSLCNESHYLPYRDYYCSLP